MLSNNHICKNKFKKFIFKLKTDHEIIKPFITTESTVLDFGCGDCGFFDSLKGMNQLIGCEINKEKIRIAKNKGYKIYTSIKQIKEKFDFIVLNEVIEHLNLEETKEFFRDVKRIVKEKTKLIISTPNPNELYTRLEEDPEHKKLYTVKELENIGKQNNFRKIKVIKHHIRVNPIKILRNISKRKDIHAGYTIIMEYKNEKPKNSNHK